MLTLALAFASVLQQQPATGSSPANAASNPVARIVISPARPVVEAQDTLRLTAEALDADGRPVPGVRLKFVPVGGRFEGSVDSTGLVQSYATGSLPVAVAAIVPGARPVISRVVVKMVAGPAARIRVSPAVSRLVVGQRLRLTGTAFSKAGDPREDRLSWKSSAPSVARVTPDGVVTALAPGRVTITATSGAVSHAVNVTVVAATIATLELAPSTVEARTGDVIRFTLKAKDAHGREITGLTPTWTFSPGQGMIDQDGAFVGYEAGPYTVTATIGNRSADAAITLRPRDVRRAATVVGRLPRKLFSTEEVWVHPNGKYAYLGTGMGGDRMYAIDISDPSRPVVTDSVVANTRRVNDVMTDPDGKFLVFTREGASDRKNGIVIASLEDPAHPRVIAQYTEGLTGGVHSAFVYRQAKYGTHVYATNDGTNALHIIDVNDPANPKTVAIWKTPSVGSGGTLHDIDLRDGLLYASWWNDGLVILDVGNGIKGGSPSNPQLVSQYKYNLDALYRQAEVDGGPGYIRGTHTAWRHRNYVFIADEVFPASSPQGTKDASAMRAYGRLQVIDVSDIEHPKPVAWYEPEFGGVHNVWVAGDTLYMGAYNAGFHAFDISGELRGGLRAQGREIVHLNTADMDGWVPNAAMTWGVVVKDGLAYVNDMNNGLWIVRMEPRRDERELMP